MPTVTDANVDPRLHQSDGARRRRPADPPRAGRAGAAGGRGRAAGALARGRGLGRASRRQRDDGPRAARGVDRARPRPARSRTCWPSAATARCTPRRSRGCSTSGTSWCRRCPACSARSACCFPRSSITTSAPCKQRARSRSTRLRSKRCSAALEAEGARGAGRGRLRAGRAPLRAAGRPALRRRQLRADACRSPRSDAGRALRERFSVPRTSSSTATARTRRRSRR